MYLLTYLLIANSVTLTDDDMN